MTRDHVCFIVPPHVLIQMIEEGSPEMRTSAVRTLAISERVRERRAVTRRLVQHEPQASVALLLPQVGVRRTVYDVHNGSQGDLPGVKVRGEGDPAGGRCWPSTRPTTARERHSISTRASSTGTAWTARVLSSCPVFTSRPTTTTRSGTEPRWCTGTATARCSSAGASPSAWT